MDKETKPRRVSKAEWLATALDMLERKGIDAVRIDRIAKRLRTSRSGFYWHFKDRDDLLDRLLEYWISEFTEDAINYYFQQELDGEETLFKLANMVDEFDLARYELPIRQWALQDERAQAAVSKANKLRMDFVRLQFKRLGFTGDQLDMRTHLFVCYHTWEKPMFFDMSKAKRAKLRRLRLELLMRR